MSLTKDAATELLHYDALTGAFFWRKSMRRAGCRKPDGYECIRVNRVLFQSHRLAWLYVNGELPKLDIDHINGDRSDNRLANLRCVTRSVNQQNLRRARGQSKTGALGVWKHRNGYRSVIKVAGRRICLGVHDSIEKASAAYIAAKRNLHEGCTI